MIETIAPPEQIKNKTHDTERSMWDASEEYRVYIGSLYDLSPGYTYDEYRQRVDPTPQNPFIYDY